MNVSVALKCYGLASSFMARKAQYKVLLLVNIRSVCLAVCAFLKAGAECHTVSGSEKKKKKNIQRI